jgi:hypothetical protein
MLNIRVRPKICAALFFRNTLRGHSPPIADVRADHESIATNKNKMVPHLTSARCLRAFASLTRLSAVDVVFGVQVLNLWVLEPGFKSDV